MQAKLPILSCTDPNTDVGKVIVEGGFGWWCESNDVAGFKKQITAIVSENTNDMAISTYRFLQENYDVDVAYNIIMRRVLK